MKHETCIETNSASQTQEVARLLGKELSRYKNSHSVVVALCGELGSGKTTFVKGLAKGLEIEANITSPTFILINKYPKKVSRFTLQASRTLYHVDPYRLKDAKDILPDLQELFTQKNVVIAVEWGEKFKEWLPKNTIWIKLTHKGKNKREIKIENDTFSTIVKKVICF